MTQNTQGAWSSAAEVRRSHPDVTTLVTQLAIQVGRRSTADSTPQRLTQRLIHKKSVNQDQRANKLRIPGLVDTERPQNEVGEDQLPLLR